MPMRRMRRQAEILDRGSLSSLRTLSVAAVVALTLATPAIGAEEASKTSANPLVAGDIKESYAEIDKILLEMEGAHVNAVAALDKIKNLPNPDEANTAADAFFTDMRERIIQMQDRLGPNSALMDSLEGAKTQVIVYKRWLERQPADFRNRDQHIATLGETLQQYDLLAEQIADGRKDTGNSLRELAIAANDWRLNQTMNAIEYSVEIVKKFVTMAETLSTSIRDVASRQGDGARPIPE